MNFSRSALPFSSPPSLRALQRRRQVVPQMRSAFPIATVALLSLCGLRLVLRGLVGGCLGAVRASWQLWLLLSTDFLLFLGVVYSGYTTRCALFAVHVRSFADLRHRSASTRSRVHRKAQPCITRIYRVYRTYFPLFLRMCVVPDQKMWCGVSV
jgi:hypothetical protein